MRCRRSRGFPVSVGVVGSSQIVRPQACTDRAESALILFAVPADQLVIPDVPNNPEKLIRRPSSIVLTIPPFRFNTFDISLRVFMLAEVAGWNSTLMGEVSALL